MRFCDSGDVDRLMDFPSLIEVLAEAFRGSLTAPHRQHHEIKGPDRSAFHLVMSAWTTGAPKASAFLGTKVVNVFSGNAAHGLPAVLGAYLLQSGETGAPLAVIDGTQLTYWRTAATSALAARSLARADAKHMTMVGAGALAPFLIRAHAAVRPLETVTIWNRSKAGADALAATFKGGPWRVQVAANLEEAVRASDIVSCATLSDKPLVMGEWLKPGAHVDLVGAFSMSMREVDDEAVRRARVFVDTPAAMTEGGDVAQALRAGAITENHIQADLADLCAGRNQGRRTTDEITLFKSIGASIEDLAAAILVWTRMPRLP